MEKLLKISENQWASNSDIYGYNVVKNAEGYYSVYSFDECWPTSVFEEKDSDIDYLQEKYNFELKED